MSRAYAVTCALVVLSAAGAGARGVPAGGTALTEDDKRVGVFAGISWGIDSNPRRDSSGAEADTITEILAGAAFTAGGERSRFDLRAEYRHDQHTDQPELDFYEFKTALRFAAGTDRFRFRLPGVYEKLSDPTDYVLKEVLERTRISCAPAVDLELGALGLGLGRSWEQLDYAEAAHDRLDLSQVAYSLELRLATKRIRQLFVHFDLGDTDYADTNVRDFEWQRVFVGLRAESGAKTGLEAGLGTDSVSKYDVSGELYALLRVTRVMQGGRSALEATASHGVEAAADADFKRATRVMLRYTKKASRRLGWMVSLSGRNYDIHNPTTISDPIFDLFIDAGLKLAVGSPGRTHGRLYVTLRHESRTAPVSADEYSRFRILFGAAAVR